MQSLPPVVGVVVKFVIVDVCLWMWLVAALGQTSILLVGLGQTCGEMALMLSVPIETVWALGRTSISFSPAPSGLGSSFLWRV